jgi:transaldolase
MGRILALMTGRAVSDVKLKRVKLFADGADLEGILALYRDPEIKGFTTNPTLMRQAGIDDYESFSRSLLEAVADRPISLEVFADDPVDMERQALKIASWGEHVYVKIPVTNTEREFMGPLVRRLVADGVKVNVTALMTVAQVERVIECVAEGPPAFVSVFAGRIADTGRDPIPIMRDSVRVLSPYPHVELIWASPREILNVVQADEIGCHVITVTHDLLKKLGGLGKDLDDFSLETVQMFRRDAQASGYQL